MTSQDANINVSLDTEENRGQVKMQHSNYGTITLTFYLELEPDSTPRIPTKISSRVPMRKFSNTPFHIFQLSRFSNIKIDPINPRKISLISSTSKTKTTHLYFEKDSGLIHFFEYLQDKFYLEQSDQDPTIFILNTQTNPPVIENVIPPFQVTSLPTIEIEKQPAISLDLLNNLKRYTMEKIIPQKPTTSLPDSGETILSLSQNSSSKSLLSNSNFSIKKTSDWKDGLLSNCDFETLCH